MDDTTVTENTSLIFSSIAPHPSVDYGSLALKIASFIIGSLGLLGNGCVILVCVIHPLRGVTNILICNQSLIDFLSSLVFVLSYGIFYSTPLPSEVKAATFVCKFWISEYPLWALAMSSRANLIYITMERYVAIIQPIVYRIKFTSTKAKMLAILPWIIGLLREIPWAISHNVEEKTCSHQWWSMEIGILIGLIVLITNFVLPLIIMAFVYIRILVKLSSSKVSDPNVTSRASRNVIKTMFIVSVTYLVCWGPNVGLYFYNNMGGYIDWHGKLYYFTVISALFNMCVNPFIYTLNYRDFRVKLGKLLTSICSRSFSGNCCHKEDNSQQTQSASNVSSRV